MISSSFFSAALAILAFNGVQAGPCRPTTVVTTEASLTETTLTTKGETTTAISTTELSVATTETTTDEDISTGTTEISVTTTQVTTIFEDASSTLTTDGKTTTELPTTTTSTFSEDVSSTETSAQDTTTMLITTTMQTLQSTTTSALTTTTSPAFEGGACSDRNDCLLSLNPVCALGLCNCIDAICTPPSDTTTCTLSSQCGAGQDCQMGPCILARARMVSAL
ncbi:hypothetical protein FPSE_07054 [Fusarium pseudograminearum CS3096]|uniref:Extracellular membrane protein CFEM domain-containing protein n=1 Tax=Fusarium pseudograminearum (strain CS3096) TaxID=1028729 RepID=K3VI68_FUSPC|nr:hypothetical protein FPSE_07054 [Fusarium pseudograminearum CS3096]EKJ72788.1 hypothetical protein FPSE_07054 [Fusarium pseudograminearum CS3096]